MVVENAFNAWHESNLAKCVAAKKRPFKGVSISKAFAGDNYAR